MLKSNGKSPAKAVVPLTKKALLTNGLPQKPGLPGKKADRLPGVENLPIESNQDIRSGFRRIK